MDIHVKRINPVTGESRDETISYTDEDIQSIASRMFVDEPEESGSDAFDYALTEQVRKWFFAEEARLWMVSMVTALPKAMGMQIDPDSELEMIARKLEKETALEDLVPRGQLNKVDFKSIAKCRMDGTVPPLR